MANRPTTGYIPPNLSETGGLLGGILKTRNAIEAGIAVVLSIIIGKILAQLLPLSIATGVGIVLAIITGIISIIGVNGEPVSIFLLNIVNYNRTRNYIPIRLPMPAAVERKYSNSQKKGGEAGKLETALENFLNVNNK